MKNALVALLMLAACGDDGGESDTPCTIAVGDFYATGCEFVDLMTGQAVGERDAVFACEADFADADQSGCIGERDAWLTCLSTTSASCDCNAERDALLDCLP